MSARLTLALAAAGALAIGAPPADAASLTRSVAVNAPPAVVWSAVGPFCAIALWHPAIASCKTDQATPPTRTLVTKDGARFVETQVARNARSYSYAFKAAPVPVTRYVSTIQVVGRKDGTSTVTWRGSYVPDEGQAQAADRALAGIYESGLEAIRASFAK